MYIPTHTALIAIYSVFSATLIREKERKKKLNQEKKKLNLEKKLNQNKINAVRKKFKLQKRNILQEYINYHKFIKAN